MGRNRNDTGERGRIPLGLACLLAVFAVGQLSCAGSDDRDVHSTVPIPGILVSSPEWSGVGDDKIAATVDDIRIPAWRVRRALRESPAGTSVAQALDMVIDEELVARRAADDTGFTPIRKSFEKTLASRYIEKHLIDEFRPEDVPMSMLEEAFKMPQVWARFNHYDLYEIQDYQWICCADPRDCDPAVSEYCFKEGEGVMKAVYEALLRDKPAPADLGILATEYRKLAYHLTYQEFQFAFDKTAGYQKGLSHIDQILAEALMKAEAGTFLPPVKSQFGWHIPYLRSHLPEVHGDLTDPAIRLEIAGVFIQRFRQQHFLELLGGLIPVDSLKLLQGYFEKRPAPTDRPAYQVYVDRDALRESASAEAGEHQKEVPNL